MLTLNRPESRNALNGELIGQLGARLGALAGDDSARAIVLTGAGDRAFCAGMDLKDFAAQSAEPRAGGRPRRRSRSRAPPDHPLGLTPSRSSPRSTARRSAAGSSSMMCCDLVVAADHVVFGLAEVKRGLMPGGGGTLLATRDPARRWRSSSRLTGETFDAHRALEIGLINRVVPADRVLDEALALAGRIADERSARGERRSSSWCGEARPRAGRARGPGPRDAAGVRAARTPGGRDSPSWRSEPRGLWGDERRAVLGSTNGRRGEGATPWRGISRPSPSSRTKLEWIRQFVRGEGRAARPDLPAPLVPPARRRDRPAGAADAGGGAGRRPLGGAPRPRARRQGLRAAEAGADQRDPRHVGLGADRVRHRGARHRQRRDHRPLRHRGAEGGVPAAVAQRRVLLVLLDDRAARGRRPEDVHHPRGARTATSG